MKKIFAAIVFVCLSLGIRAQENLGPIKWISFEEAERLDSVEHRPFLIDVYTDWCGWCKRMMATTFQHQQLASYINQNFYCVRFDAETKDTVNFLGRQWTSVDGRVNALAPHMLGSRLSYPTIVYLDREKHIYPIPGFMEVRDIEPILVYFAEELPNFCELETFKDLYMCSFRNEYRDDIKKLKSLKCDTTGKINWLTVNEAKKLSEKEKKPILVDIYIDDKYRGYLPYITMSSIVHEKAVLKDSSITNFINKNFYPIRIEATTTDSIYWYGNDRPFVSTGESMPNQFVNALMNGNYKFPAMYFFDKDAKYVANINSFFQPSFWNTVLKFYAQEAYLKESFEQFYKRTITNTK